jgi:F-type H+-transporting ATPase subunit delta
VSESKVARRYAQALIELCDEAQNHAMIGKQLAAFATTYAASAELRGVLTDPGVPAEARRGVLTAVLTKLMAAPVTRNFLFVLVDNDRIDQVAAIAAEFERHLDRVANRVRATVTSAVPLSPAEVSRIQIALQRLTGATVAIETRLDPTLIGGVVTKIGDIVLDGSVRSDLDALREALTT